MDPLNTQHKYEEYPIVLRKKVHDVVACSVEVDVEVMGSPQLLHHLLVELCSSSLGRYRVQLNDWIQQYLLHLKMVSK